MDKYNQNKNNLTKNKNKKTPEKLGFKNINI